MRFLVDLRALSVEAGSVEEARAEAIQALIESPDLLGVLPTGDRSADLYAQEMAARSQAEQSQGNG